MIGVSQGGYWVPRALAFEHRLAAAVVDPGVIDVSTSWLEPLPNIMRKQLEQGDRTAFDREMHLAELFSPGTAATLRFRGNPYGANHTPATTSTTPSAPTDSATNYSTSTHHY